MKSSLENHDRCQLSLASPGTVTGNGRPSIASTAAASEDAFSIGRMRVKGDVRILHQKGGGRGTVTGGDRGTVTGNGRPSIASTEAASKDAFSKDRVREYQEGCREESQTRFGKQGGRHYRLSGINQSNYRGFVCWMFQVPLNNGQP